MLNLICLFFKIVTDKLIRMFKKLYEINVITHDSNFGYAISLNSNAVDKLNYRKFDRSTDQLMQLR